MAPSRLLVLLLVLSPAARAETPVNPGKPLSPEEGLKSIHVKEGFAVELVALRHLRATTVTMVAMLEPVGVAALGWVWFHESLGLVGTLGCLAVVAGIVLAQTARRAPVVVEPPHL